MTPCDDCLAAERDPHGIGVSWRDRLCCIARDLALTPRRLQRQAFDAVTAGMAQADVEAVRERARALVMARKEAA